MTVGNRMDTRQEAYMWCPPLVAFDYRSDCGVYHAHDRLTVDYIVLDIIAVIQCSNS